MKNVLIVEPEPTGHHLVLYVYLVIKAVLRAGYNPILMISERSKNSSEYELLIKCVGRNIDVVYLRDHRNNSEKNLSIFMYQVRLLIEIRTAFARLKRKTDVFFVFMTNIDHIDKVLSISINPFKGVPLSGIVMNPKFHRYEMNVGDRSRNDSVFRLLFMLLVKKKWIHYLCLTDEVFVQYMHRFNKFKSKLIYLPEPGEVKAQISKPNAKNKLGIDEYKFVVLVYGYISKRKGLQFLLNAIRDASDKFCVCVAGELSEYAKKLLDCDYAHDMVKKGCLVIKPGFKSVDEQANLFSAADVVWVAYVDNYHGSSGVFFQAASLGLPVIVSDRGLLKWMCDKYKNGIACNPEIPSDILDVITALGCDANLYSVLSENSRRLGKSHTYEEFIKKIISLLR